MIESQQLRRLPDIRLVAFSDTFRKPTNHSQRSTFFIDGYRFERLYNKFEALHQSSENISFCALSGLFTVCGYTSRSTMSMFKNRWREHYWQSQ